VIGMGSFIYESRFETQPDETVATAEPVETIPTPDQAKRLPEHIENSIAVLPSSICPRIRNRSTSRMA
jgi:hypothetical protein